ncbi:P-loop containing nucleoside triphosphate hydrolase protein [Suillus fuscotomentosus]|uniref:P-loop containing nucleoside triphosphate hydrolase protein n=1 Tax=Suillus fuscotomentosus TaxID=1912939 RepID=A0AAD4HR78_9AGAM|nr:P-loop containing nucleoside triphosphate hydrolase protein [Suillus fuscotomentosus]KAG1905606.1 P-loop containing nucleoside triphosphate hydrolase protein [Suillus fuscotomentosus]
MAKLIEVCNVACKKDKKQVIFSQLNFDVNERDIIVLQGKSGAGKTTLLKCIAHLNVYDGEILYRGGTAKTHGVPVFRTRVFYVPQRPALLPGTPRDFMAMVTSFQSRKLTSESDLANAMDISKGWGVDHELWDRNWTSLSGGEAQRIALAAAVGLNTAEVLLLDEPTSALDHHSTKLVEDFILNALRSPQNGLKAIVWITHSEEQARRVGTRFLRISTSGCEEEPLMPEP